MLKYLKRKRYIHSQVSPQYDFLKQNAYRESTCKYKDF